MKHALSNAGPIATERMRGNRIRRGLIVLDCVVLLRLSHRRVDDALRIGVHVLLRIVRHAGRAGLNASRVRGVHLRSAVLILLV